MKNDFYLVLPDIRSCHNVGALFRTADAFNITKIFLVGYTAAPPKPQIDKVSLGAEKWIPFEQRKDLEELILELKSKKIKIIALEKSKKSVDLSTAKFSVPLALIIGNEVDGVNSEILELCDKIVHIPMYGKKESLNVSVAAGIAMYSIKARKALKIKKA